MIQAHFINQGVLQLILTEKLKEQVGSGRPEPTWMKIVNGHGNMIYN